MKFDKKTHLRRQTEANGLILKRIADAIMAADAMGRAWKKKQ